MAAVILGIVAADPGWPDRSDHAVAVLDAAEARTVIDAFEDLRRRTWTTECPGAWRILVREDAIDLTPALRTDEGVRVRERWEGDWRVDERCLGDQLAVIAPMVSKERDKWGFRAVLPIDATVPEGLLAVSVDPGLPQARVTIEGGMLGWERDDNVALEDLLDARTDAAVAALTVQPVKIGFRSGHGSFRGDLQVDARHLDLWFARGADLSALNREMAAAGIEVDQLWVPDRWTVLVVLDDPDPAGARALLPQAIEVTPW